MKIMKKRFARQRPADHRVVFHDFADKLASVMRRKKPTARVRAVGR